MISSILVINKKGEILINRSYKGDVFRSNLQDFIHKVIIAKEAGEVPIQSINGCHFIHLIVGDLILVAATKSNANAMLVVKFLYVLVDVFKGYFGQNVTENAVRKHFVLIYELLDEVIDYGLPQITEIDVLKKYITQGGMKDIDLNDANTLKQITVQATGNTSWRAEGIKYRINKISIDLVENVNALISVKGQLLRADVSGQLIVKSQLSGMPECKIGMNDKLVMNSHERRMQSSADLGITIDDVRFHQCVRLSKYDSERTITFIPPDGTFELMSYRVTENIELPFRVLPAVVERSRNKIEVSVKVRANFAKALSAQNVIIKIPVPRNSAKTNFYNVGTGRATFEHAESSIFWRIKKFPGLSEFSLSGEVELANSVTEVKWNRPPISLEFQVPGLLASGLRIRFLRINERSNYKALMFTQNVTKAGHYQYRI